MRFTALGLLALATGAHAALFGPKSKVTHITPYNFQDEILDVKKPALVAFTAPWCGHCRNLAPHFDRVASELDGIVKIAYIDCDDTESQPLCAQYDVKGFPTVKLFPATKRRIPKEYLGERKAKAIMNYMLDALPAEVVKKIDVAGLADFANGASSPRVLLVSPMGKTTPMYRSLALDYLGRIPFAHMYAGKDGVVEAVRDELDADLTKDKLPGLYFIDASAAKRAVKYRGSMKYSYIKLWIDEHLGGADADAARQRRKAAEQAAAEQEAELRAQARAALEKERAKVQPNAAYGEDDAAAKMRKFEEAFARMSEEDAMEQLKHQTDRAYMKKLLDARARLKQQENVQDKTSTNHRITKDMLFDKLQSYMGEKWGARLAEHAEKTQRTIERMLMIDPHDTVTAMNTAESEFIEMLRQDQTELETQVNAGADEDGYPLPKDAIDSMKEHLETIAGLISTMEFRISARTNGIDEREQAEKMLNKLHDEL